MAAAAIPPLMGEIEPPPEGQVDEIMPPPPKTIEELKTWLLETDDIDVKDLNNWLPKSIAAKVLGMSERSLERRIADNQIEKRDRALADAGRKPLPVVNPLDVRQLLRATLPMSKPMILPPAETERRREVMEMVPRVVDRFAATLDAMTSRLVPPPPPPLFMDLDTAAEQAGIKAELQPAFKRLLKRAIRDGTLPAQKVGKQIFIHRDHLFNFGRVQPTPITKGQANNGE